jgi:hypothetical protein
VAVPTILQCHGCRHYAWGALDGDRCSAFLEGIPREIWVGDADHHEPFPHDGGVRRDLQDPGPAGNLTIRHRAWGKRSVVRFPHQADALGAIAARLPVGADAIASSLDASLDAETLRDAWQKTDDAPAMLLVLLRAQRLGALARAVHLTTSQLAVEGCDYLDNKGWLGVGLTLGSYQTESSFANARAAWSALTSPFGDGYLTTRVHQTLVRNIRRILPEPPPAAEWAHAEHHLEGVGPLGDAVVAMRVAPISVVPRAEDLALLEPWAAVANALGLEAELARELAPGHRLYGRAGLRAIARRTDCEDVLFVSDAVAVVVQLTWAKEQEPTLPATELFASIDDWVTRRMNPDHDAFAGQAPRAFAFELRSALTLEQMKDKLPDATRWEWTVGDSAWYGSYLCGKDGSTRIRIFAKDEPERFGVQADLVDPADRGKDWFATTRPFVLDSLLPSIEAADPVETTPEQD